jgi:hypothetical protein
MALNGTVTTGMKHGLGEKASSREVSLSALRHDKRVEVLDACRRKDTVTLRALAASEGGLLTDELRRQACMSLS